MSMRDSNRNFWEGYRAFDQPFIENEFSNSQ